MCVHSHLVDDFDYPYKATINPMLESIANGPGLTKRIKKLFDKFLHSLCSPQNYMNNWTNAERKHLHFLFLTRFNPITPNQPVVPIAEATEPQKEPSTQIEPFETLYVRSIFCKCFDHTPKIQKVMVNNIFHVNQDGSHTRTTRVFGCPWYVIVVISWIMGTAFNGKMADYLSKYETLLLENRQPTSLTPENIKELRFASILYHLGVEDLFYISQRGQILPEIIQPNFCLEIPAGISMGTFYTALETVFGFSCVADKGWDQSSDVPNTTFEILTTFKRRIISNDRHGPFEDFLGYINDLTGPRGFLDKHGRETNQKMTWMGTFILKRPGYIPTQNTLNLHPVPGIATLFDFDRNPLTLPLLQDSSSSSSAVDDQASVDAPAAATGTAPVTMAAALEAAWTADVSVPDAVPAAAVSISSSSSPWTSPSYSQDSPSYSPPESPSFVTLDLYVPSPVPIITSHSFDTPVGTPSTLNPEALDFEPEDYNINESTDFYAEDAYRAYPEMEEN